MIDASVIIPSYNRKEILQECLKALFNQSYPENKYEIILVDDGSTDGTEKMISELNTPSNLTYIRNEKRIGQPKSRNKAIDIARGKYTIFVDSDIIVVPEFISEHLRYHRLHGDSIVNGQLIYISDLKEVGEKRKGFWDISFSSFNTANVSVRREHLDQVGSFDMDLLPYGWQDVELGYRLRKMGLKSRKNRKAIGYHYRQWADTSNFAFLKEKELMRGMSGAIYYKKHPCFKVWLSVRANPLFAFSFVGRWMEKSSRGKELFHRIKRKNIQWVKAALMKLILCHYYLQGYEQKIKED